MRSPGLIWFLLSILSGVGAGLIAEGQRPPRALPGEFDLHRQDFELTRPDDKILVRGPDGWEALNYVFGDVDLITDVELGPDTELDIVVRRVEPRQLAGEILPFHGRFSVLRLSSSRDGKPWLSREEALFGGATGGVRVEPGQPATVRIEMRGRRLVANVAGRPLPPYEAADTQGYLAFIARHGKVAFPTLKVVQRGTPEPWPAWLFGGGGGLLLAVLALALRVRGSRLLAAAALLPISTGLLVRAIWFDVPPLLEPSPAVLVLVTLAGVPLAAGLLPGGRRAVFAGGLGLLLVLVAGDLGRRMEAPRWLAAPALDAVFGARAGNTLCEALAQRIRGPLQVHTLELPARRVLLLGGELLTNRGMDPRKEGHLVPHLLGELRRTAADVEVLSLPTEDGWSQQQWELYSRYFTGFAPAVLVFGVPRDEAAPMALPEAAATLVQPPPSRGLLDLLARVPERPRSTPAALAATLAAVQDASRQHGQKLVLLADAGLQGELLAVVRAAAKDTPLVELLPADDGRAAAVKLATAVAPLLAK